MVVGGEKGRQPCLGSLKMSNDLAPQDAVISRGKLARMQFRFVLEESGPRAVNLKTGEQAHVKLVGNTFYSAAQIHDAMGGAKLAACPARVAAAGASGAPRGAVRGEGPPPRPGARGS
eukprot:4230349-Pyramimonas_sp.AAC.1